MPFSNKAVFVKGYFPESAKNLSVNNFSFVNLDVDLYKPMIAGLEFFYPKLSRGGYIMVHDFWGKNYKGVRRAVCEFCNKKNIRYVRLFDVGGSIVICK